MNASHRRQPTEERDLQQKRVELASLRAKHAEARAVLQRLRDDIAGFEGVYHRALGSRIAELERIEAEISRRSGHARREPQRDQGAYSETVEEIVKESVGDDFRQSAGPPPAKDIKALYREVAKTIHPDLGGGGSSKDIRHELMAKANRAYAEDDRRTLQEILRNWRRSPDQAVEDCGPDLAQLLRQIARERQEIRALGAKVEELKGSYVWRFKKRVEANLAMGIDVLADMVADTDLDIGRALKRLAALTGEKVQAPVQKAPKPRRKLNFPEQASCGTVHLRDQSSISYNTWKVLGPARGCLEIEVDQAVRLDVRDQALNKLSQLQGLQFDDLQSLFLYEVGDADLEGIVHLTGLEELYLSGTRLTDGALNRIASLTNLKRLYLYQTDITDGGLAYLLHLPALVSLTSSGNAITEAGLAALRLASPGVKTVSFSWKR